MTLRPFSLVTRLTLLAGLLLTGTVLIFGLRSRQAGQARAVTQWQERLRHEANLAALKVQGFIDQVGGDARYLARIPSVQDYAAAPDQAGARDRVEQDFRALLLGKPVYAQVRLIGERDAGREVVRLDHTDEGITATPETRLQQKGDRDYLVESAGLPPGGIYFSEMDLNRDFGHITEPRMPTLRAVTPVVNPQGGTFGWIVINADLRPLLQDIERQAASGLQLCVANSEGSYLLHPDPAWRFGHDLGLAFNSLRPGVAEEARRRGLWQVFTGSYEFSPGQPRHFHVEAGTDGRAALADLQGARQEALFASALTAAAGLVLLVILARLVTRRLRRVADALGHFGTGGPVPPLPEHPADEIGRLAAAFNRMSGKIADQVSTLEEARRQADEASRAKDDFLAVMSHEIRTPLNAVTGMLHVLDRNHPAPHQEPILRSLNAAAGHLTSLLNEALDWSKIKAGGLVSEPAPFALGPLLTDLELTHRPLAAQKGLRWSLINAPELPPVVSADRLRLSQILHNLLSNAVKFTSSGYVRLAVSWLEGRLTCRVEDSGIGIQESDIGRIFSPFDQAHGEIGRRFGGTGLGLSISRSLAELMGGQLTAESRPGEGSSFVLTLPCPAAASGATAAPPDRPAPALTGLHVLCVEDSSLGREVLTAFLEAAGVTFRMAATGAEALESLAEDQAFHAVLLDLQLPDTNGMELAGKIHTLHPGLPLIAVTAQTGETTRAACETAGFAAFLTKPLDPFRLQEALARTTGPLSAAPPPRRLPDPPPESPSAALLTELFAHEPDRLRRVLFSLAGEFQNAATELEAAAACQDLGRARRLRHKLHSAIAGLALTPLDHSFAALLGPDWAEAGRTLCLLREAGSHCSARAASAS